MVLVSSRIVRTVEGVSRPEKRGVGYWRVDTSKPIHHLGEVRSRHVMSVISRWRTSKGRPPDASTTAVESVSTPGRASFGSLRNGGGLPLSVYYNTHLEEGGGVEGPEVIVDEELHNVSRPVIKDRRVPVY